MNEAILTKTYLEEQERWRLLVRELFGDEWTLVSVSNDCSDIRVYRSRDHIYKIRRLTKASFEGRINSLETEYVLLSRLSGVFREVPPVFSYRMVGDFEVLSMGQLPRISS